MVNGFKSLICMDFLAIPFMVYAFIKLAIPANTDSTLIIQFILCILHILLTLIIVPLVSIFILCCTFYQKLVKILAKIKYGKAFHDILRGADACWSITTTECKSIVHIMYLIENLSNVQELKNFWTNQNLQSKILKNHPRLACKRKYFLGYYFYVSTEINYNEVVRDLDDYNTIQEFYQVINKVTASPLPCNDEFMWEVLIGRKPIELHPGKFQLPFVMRFHHTVADGITFMAFLISNYATNGIEKYKLECERVNKCVANKTNKIRSKITRFNINILLKKCKNYLCTKIFYHFDMLRHKEPKNSLHGKMSGEKLVCFSFEGINDRLLDKVKRTKNVLNVSFNDVLLSAVGASFAEYFKKNDPQPPKTIMSANPFFLNVAHLDKLVEFNNEGEPVTQLGNKLTIGLIELPTDDKVLENPVDTIYRLHQTTDRLKNSMDLNMAYWMFNVVVNVIPKSLLQVINKFYDYTAIVSNMPGIMSLSIGNDYKLEDIFVWTNNFGQSGITITLFTYDNLFRITAHADKLLVNDPNDLQKLSDNILRYINFIHDKTCI